MGLRRDATGVRDTLVASVGLVKGSAQLAQTAGARIGFSFKF